MSGRVRSRLRESARALGVNARSPNLRYALASFGAAWTAEWAFTVAISVVAFRDGGAVAVGLVTSVRMVVAAALLPVATPLADRFPRERVLRWSCWLRAAALAACTLTLALDGPSLVLYAFVVVASAAFVVYRPGHAALMPSLCLTPLELTSATVACGLIDSVGTLAGPALAAVLLGLADPAVTFGVTTALALASGICLLGVSFEAAPRVGGASESRLGEIVEGFRLLRRDRETGRLAVLAAVQTFTRGCLSVFVIVVAVDVLGMGDAGAGVLTAALGTGAVVGSLAVSMIADGRRLAVLFGVGVALWGLPLVVVGAVPRDVATLAMLATIGFANALVDVGLLTLPARRVPDASLARVFGAITALATFAVAVGSLVTPPVIELLGIRWSLVVVGLAGPVAVAASWPRLREIDRTVVARDADIEMLRAIPMLRPLPMPAIENLAARLGRLQVAAGQPVFAQGDGGDRYYVIEHGAADVVRNGQPVRTLGDGDGFGEIALVRDVPRTATVVARTALELRTVDRPDFVLTVGGFSASRDAADGVVSGRLAADAAADARPQH